MVTFVGGLAAAAGWPLMVELLFPAAAVPDSMSAPPADILSNMVMLCVSMTNSAAPVLTVYFPAFCVKLTTVGCAGGVPVLK